VSLGPPSTAGGASRQVSPLPVTLETPLYQGPTQTGWRKQSRANKRLARPGASSVQPSAAVGGPGRARHQCGFGGAGDGCGGLPPKRGSPPGPPPTCPHCGGSRLPAAGGERRVRTFQCRFPQASPHFLPLVQLGSGRGRSDQGAQPQSPQAWRSCRGARPPPPTSQGSTPTPTPEPWSARPHSEPESRPLKGALFLQAEHQAAVRTVPLCPHLCPHPSLCPRLHRLRHTCPTLLFSKPLNLCIRCSLCLNAFPSALLGKSLQIPPDQQHGDPEHTHTPLLLG